MSKRAILKFVLAMAVLAGTLSAARPAKAIGCADICCDSNCFSVRHCFGRIGNCICEEFCSID
jgi:hypothetical protein